MGIQSKQNRIYLLSFAMLFSILFTLSSCEEPREVVICEIAGEPCEHPNPEKAGVYDANCNCMPYNDECEGCYEFGEQIEILQMNFEVVIDGIQISWTQDQNTNDVIGYELAYSFNGRDYEPLDTLSSSSEINPISYSYLHQVACNYLVHFYRIQAVMLDGTSCCLAIEPSFASAYFEEG